MEIVRKIANKYTSKYEKLAFNALASNPKVMQAMRFTSQSDNDFQLKVNAYVKSLAFTAECEDMALNSGAKRSVLKFASAGSPGMAAANLRGTTLFPATILNYVSSIAPIFCVERDINSPRMDLQFFDVYNVMDGSTVTPNLGQDTSFGNPRYSKNVTPNGTLKTDSIDVLKPIVPGSIRVTVSDANGIHEMFDNGKGQLYGEPGFVAASAINYQTGHLEYEFATAPLTGTSWNVSLVTDKPATDELEALAAETKYFSIDTDAIIIPFRRNIVTDVAMNRQGVVDPNEVYTNLIQTQYTKLINQKIVNSLVGGLKGDAYACDLSAYTLAAGFGDSLKYAFASALVDGETELGRKSYKGAKVNGILAGYKVGNIFQSLTPDEGWTPNDKLSYFKDVIGWYKGVPVVRWEDTSVNPAIAPDEVILSHRHEELAPVARAMFVTPTDIPEVGNYKNPTQLANGMFSIEGIKPASSKLTVKMKFNLPAVTQLTVL